MATFKPKLPLVDKFLTSGPGQVVEEVTSIASKAMRFKVLWDREKRGFQKAEIKGEKGAYTFEGTTKPNNVESLTKPESLGYTNELVNRKEAIRTSAMVDRISIIDIDTAPPGTRGLKAKRTYYEYITLPFVPRELAYSMSSKFVGIATLGRNNPYYQFTGSEDTLTFEIDWFSNQLDRKDVINNCRWVEALTKADGYNSVPHRIKLVWGANNILWQDDIWIVTAAPYRLKDFNRGYRKKNVSGAIDARGEFISTSMLPQQAFQSITLKRVTSLNRSREEILNIIT
jgi:hypothetical protein